MTIPPRHLQQSRAKRAAFFLRWLPNLRQARPATIDWRKDDVRAGRQIIGGHRIDEELNIERERHLASRSAWSQLDIVNTDGFGEEARLILDRLASRLRCCDRIGWRSPDRIILLLVETDLAGAERVAEDLRDLLQATLKPLQIELRSTEPTAETEGSFGKMAAEETLFSAH